MSTKAGSASQTEENSNYCRRNVHGKATMAQNQRWTRTRDSRMAQVRFKIRPGLARKINADEGENQPTDLFANECQTWLVSPSGRVVGCVLESDNCLCLGTFLPLDDVELHVIPFFQGFVSVQLNRGIVNEYVGAIFASDESIALGVVKPLDLPFVLSHNFLLSCTVRVVFGEQW